MKIPRRKLLKYTIATAGTYSIIEAVDRQNKLRAEQKNSNIAVEKESYIMTPDQVISELMRGNQRFIRQITTNRDRDILRLREVSEAQSPFACILTCADSRVPPEIIFDRGLGDLFVVRDAGNIATPGEIGSLEYGALVLGAKAIIVMGHQDCGAVRAAMKLGATSGFIGSIVNEILPAIQISRQQEGDLVYNSIISNIILQKQKIQTSPVISKLIQENKIKVVGAYYNLQNGKVDILE